ncbi:TPA: hypothetical protein DDW35_11945, partial [Candidatus Sumerlaeota bacterium]|nr:hypothetical protein [Candidatus Sumerlaeota bacterium]
PIELLARMKEWLLNDQEWLQILPLAQTRVEKLSDIIPMAAFFFADQVSYDPAALVPKKVVIEEGKTPADLAEVTDLTPGFQIARLIRIALWEFEKVRQWNAETVQGVLTRLAEKEGVKMRDMMPAFFTAVTGSPTSVPLFDAMAILGSDMSRRRLNTALETLATAGHVLSGKKLKALEGYYATAYGVND